MSQSGYTPISLYYSTTASAAPTSGNMANGELAINITDGKLFYKDNGGTVQTIAYKVVPATAGGTGQTTYTTGDILYASATNTVSKLAAGSNGYVLTMSGGLPTWAASTGGVTSFSAGTTGFSPSTGTTGSVTLSGTLNVANGGTGQTSYTDGQLLIGNSTGNTLAKATLTAGSGITITNGSGAITIASTGSLPSQSGNSGKYLYTDGSNASWEVISGALATPTLSASTTTPTGGATVSITITNYNNAYTYVIAVQAGSYTFNTSTGVISWAVPNVASVTSYNCTVQATYGGPASLVATQTVSVQTSLVVDTSISITDFSVYSSNNGWAI